MLSYVLTLTVRLKIISKISVHLETPLSRKRRNSLCSHCCLLFMWTGVIRGQMLFADHNTTPFFQCERQRGQKQNVQREPGHLLVADPLPARCGNGGRCHKDLLSWRTTYVHRTVRFHILQSARSLNDVTRDDVSLGTIVTRAATPCCRTEVVTCRPRRRRRFAWAAARDHKSDEAAGRVRARPGQPLANPEIETLCCRWRWLIYRWLLWKPFSSTALIALSRADLTVNWMLRLYRRLLCQSSPPSCVAG